MTRTGARAAALSELLEAAGLAASDSPPRPRITNLPDSVSARIDEVYRALEGNPDALHKARPGAFDLCVSTAAGPLIVELDEEQHFNRYRATTLALPWAESLPWASAYREYSRFHEADLARKFISGGRWTNNSAPRFFGAASAPGDFTGVGSPRWRQRAFYDVVKDLLPGISLARIAVFDVVDGSSVNTILRSKESSAAAALRRLVESRTHSWSTS
jgi:hypothetical protein